MDGAGNVVNKNEEQNPNTEPWGRMMSLRTHLIVAIYNTLGRVS